MSLDILLPILLGYTAHIAPQIKSIGVSRHLISTLHAPSSTLMNILFRRTVTLVTVRRFLQCYNTMCRNAKNGRDELR